MKDNDKCDNQSILFHELEEVLYRARQENDITYAEVIGILETLKTTAIEEYLNLMQEEGD